MTTPAARPAGPLAGRRVLVTRPRAQAAELSDRLAALGAHPIEAPLIRIESPEDGTALRQAAAGAAHYDWIVFTSGNAVAALLDALPGGPRDLHASPRPLLCAIGTGTADRLARAGLRADAVPEEFRAEAVVPALLRRGDTLAGARVLLPRADIGRAVIATQLRAAGALVTDVVAYRTVLEDQAEAQADVRRLLQEGRVDVVTFTSGSAVRAFASLHGAEEAVRLLARTVVAVLGPTTARAAVQLGMSVGIQPSTYTVPALVDAMASHFSKAPLRGRMVDMAVTTAPRLHLPRRPRRLRRSEAIRSLVRETRLTPDCFIYPLFVCEGEGVRREIGSMPGVFQLSADEAVKEAAAARAEGIPGVLLFGLPARKDEIGSLASDPEAPVQSAIRALKRDVPGLVVMTDVCLCEYTSHGHCGVLDGEEILNDATVHHLVEAALSHAVAGADFVAPSDMMDGRVGAIRQALDERGFDATGIVAYAAKYCSGFYGPFREAADSVPQFGDRRSHQMDPANVEEALREVEADIQEGADIVMVKPALPYLDVVAKVKARFGQPTAAYHVSGEYAMLKAAAERGWIDEERVMLETLTSIRRAGADIIITYYARQAARILAAPSA